MGGKGSGRDKKPPRAKELLKKVFPINDLFDPDELVIYESLIDIYLNDFDEEELTSSDMDDIMSLATNKILEIRLLKESRGSAIKHLDVSTAIEKIRKENQKLKENLSSRRKDRINPNEFKGFSIVDLVAAYDDDKKTKLLNKVKELGKEETEAVEKRADYYGNRYDVDSNKQDNAEEGEVD